MSSRKIPTTLMDAKHSLGRAKYRLLNKAKGLTDANEYLFDKVKPFTMSSRLKLRSLKKLAEAMNHNGVPGDFVECGTFKGGSAAVISTALTPQRKLWLFDSFEGLPDVRDVDGAESKDWVGKCRGAETDVIKALETVGISPDQYVIRKGWFQDTFKEMLPTQVALLHCDADWYDSVLLTLETFYDRIPVGGVVVLDDFGWWEGCREAFYDFCSQHGEKPLLERVSCDQAYWIKGKSDNRDHETSW